MDNRITVLIPMNGLGNRFRDEDYYLPKPLINVLGQPMLFWLLDNLNLALVDSVVMPYTSALDAFDFQHQLQDRYPAVKFVFHSMDQPTRGAAETVLLALNELPASQLDRRIMLLDCDTFYFDDIIGEYITQVRGNHIFYFNDVHPEPLYSYIVHDGERVTGIAEKIKISNSANTGAYAFESGAALRSLCQELIGTDQRQQGEFYISGLYQLILDTVTCSPVQDFVCVGTPTQLKIFCENRRQVTPQRFCFDLDNTLVTRPLVAGDYATCQPIAKNIAMLQYLHRQGHYIIISTARRMRTHAGNVNAVLADVGALTLQQLSELNIPYDEIHFGKPWADFYIDDRAINCNLNLDKQLGYYNTVTPSRSFNQVEFLGDAVVKTGQIQGEVYYYKHIPEDLQSLFPALIRGTDDELVIERIAGINFSHLYTTGVLSEELLLRLLKRLLRLHQRRGIFKTNWRQAQQDKILHRWRGHNYSQYGDDHRVLDAILEYLNQYQIQHSCMIHGDPVFTNIMIDNHADIKMIDMRGSIGSEFTIYGDALYDLAKVYQSLIGYDFILNDTDVRVDQRLITVLDTWLQTHYNSSIQQIQGLTAGLFFSLIPLHNDHRCQRYFDLAERLICPASG